MMIRREMLSRSAAVATLLGTVGLLPQAAQAAYKIGRASCRERV